MFANLHNWITYFLNVGVYIYLFYLLACCLLMHVYYNCIVLLLPICVMFSCFLTCMHHHIVQGHKILIYWWVVWKSWLHSDISSYLINNMYLICMKLKNITYPCAWMIISHNIFSLYSNCLKLYCKACVPWYFMILLCIYTMFCCLPASTHHHVL